MAKGKKQKDKTIETTHYQHDDAKRKNIPSAAMEAEGKVPMAKRVKYAYSPHLDPILRFDPTGRADKVQSIVDKACRGERLSASEQEILRAVGQNWERPWLEWAGKQADNARGNSAVDPVALHIHERISAQAILRHAMREDAQRSLFGDPEQTYAEALQFYRHDVDWANRLILGDSLQVMSSLAQRENLTGKVQMIYIDPPYGIRFASNFQPELGNRNVKDGRDEDLTREPEMVRAYRDTWHLGQHSYLQYMRARLAAARSLLTETGSVFVQINDAGLAMMRLLLDEIFGLDCYCGTIAYVVSSGLGANLLPRQTDNLLWYTRRSREQVHYRQILKVKAIDGDGASAYRLGLLPDGQLRALSRTELEDPSRIDPMVKVLRHGDLTKPGPGSRYTVEAFGRAFSPGKRWWGLPEDAMRRGLKAERVSQAGATLAIRRFLGDFPAYPITNIWSDTATGAALDKQYVVQTNPLVVERCMLMTTEPGDLILDPTCGSGTTAAVAEQWGRRWITIDTSRVALSVARERLLTSRFEHYRTRSTPNAGSPSENPACGFKYRTIPHITLGAVAQNRNLDAIFARHEPLLEKELANANAALSSVSTELRRALKSKLEAQQKISGKRSISDAERRRWLLPPDNRDPNEAWTIDVGFQGWYPWEVPFDTDPDWPQALTDAVIAYRIAWSAKMNEVNKCIADNAEQEELVDQPEVAKNVVRVSGPFTVEGVIPEELSLGADGLFDGTPNEFGPDGTDVAGDRQNLSAYLSRMVSHLRSDGLTFLNNQHKNLDALTPLFEEGSASSIHAEGNWAGEPDSAVGVTFGPQYGPVTALQVEDAIRSAKRFSDLVIAGFSFDAETYAIVEAQQHPRLRIHIAQIRPDLNESMDGLLKNTPNSQLFTVFGQPDIEVKETKDGWVCKLDGVMIYDPTENTLRSAHADKVAAWFLDSDYDGRCFCATQAFFPNKDAWEKIAKALGSQADADAFEAFNGTKSLPFQAGQYKRIAVKVIDPRGNEVMAIRKLK